MKTAGYSGTPLHKKLGIKPGDRAWFSGAPEGYEEELAKAGGYQRFKTLGSAMQFLHIFSESRTKLEGDIPKMVKALAPDGILWISWLKKSSGVLTDLDENVVREIGLRAGVVDVKVCAVDERWSGLKFVFRLKDRPGKSASRR